MTTKTPKSQSRFRLPDPPQREPDEMTSYDHLQKLGSAHYLALHFGRPDTTLVEAERGIIAQPDADRSRGRRPDLLIAFDVNPAAYEASNGYIISEQGKPPDFVMEIASETTAETDVGEKRDEYAALGIGEYWRFDQSASITAPDWPETAWWTVSTCPSQSRNCPTAICRATAQRST